MSRPLQTRDYASLSSFREILQAAHDWSQESPIDELERAEDGARANFPITEIERGLTEPTYEAAEAAGFALCDWIRDVRQSDPEALYSIESAIGKACPAPDRKAVQSLRRTIMPGYLFDPETNLATAHPHDVLSWSSVPEGGAATLGHLALCHGLQASVFNRPVGSDLVYDGHEALSRLPGDPLPKPVGCRPAYKITVLDGELKLPPAWPPIQKTCPLVEPPTEDWIAIIRSRFRAPDEDGLYAQVYALPLDMGKEEALDAISEDVLDDGTIEHIEIGRADELQGRLSSFRSLMPSLEDSDEPGMM